VGDAVSAWMSFFDSPTGMVEELTKRERYHLQQQWRERFLAHVKALTGKWGGNRSRDWLWLDDREARFLKGARAEEAYRRLQAADYLVLPSQTGLAALRCSQRPLPDLGSLTGLLQDFPGLLDVYIMAPDLSWTFVVAHEPLSGPYFRRTSEPPD
jgi:hypothetical protein